MHDIRDDIFNGLAGVRAVACIYACSSGILSGVAEARKAAGDVGVEVVSALDEGSDVRSGEEVMRITGTPKQIAVAEDVLMGLMSKPSGVASAANRFVREAGRDMRVVSGAGKKVPLPEKEMLRHAVVVGGAQCRITERPMVYLDKNYVVMLGGIARALDACSGLEGRVRVVQLRGREPGGIVQEARTALEHGAGILFVDTGEIEDAMAVLEQVKGSGQTPCAPDGTPVQVAYGGGVTFDDVATLRCMGVDLLDVGRAIIDAPLLDMHMEVTDVG